MKNWALPAAMLVAAECVAAAILAPMAGFSRFPPLADSLSIAVVCAGLSIGWIIRGKPTRNNIDANIGRIRAVIVGGFLLAVQYSLLTWCKMLLPYVSGFWADPLLANIDYAVFGADPWKLLRPLPSSPIEFAYGAWLFINPLVIFALLSSKSTKAKGRAIFSLFLLIAMGAFGQFLLPSAGPIFYDLAGHGNRFVGVLDTPMALSARHWLWLFHLDGTVKAGIGISAMPSMHVAQATWLCFVAKEYAPRLFVPALAFLALIWSGSVYLGFHYVSDGAVGMALAVGAWRLLDLKFNFQIGDLHVNRRVAPLPDNAVFDEASR